MEKRLTFKIADKAIYELYSDLVPNKDDIIVLSSGKYRVIGREMSFGSDRTVRPTPDRVVLKIVEI